MSGNRNASIRRLQQELRDLSNDTEYNYEVVPIDDNIFEWHFSIQGAPDSVYEGGIYHGKIIFPTEYPFKPPDIIILTNSGRFEVGKKICLNATGYHPDQWKPSWSVKTLLIALSSFMVTEGEGAVGSVDIPAEKRKELAQKSRNYTCSVCGMSHETLYKKWDKKKETDDDDEDDRGKDEMTKSPDETQGTSEEPSTQQTTAEDSAAQPQEKLNPMEILRRRRASRMKQKATEASSKEVEDENRTEQDSGNQGTEENGERGNGREILHDGNNAPADGEGSELVLAPEETIRNAILDKTIVLIILAIIILALRKWLFSLNKNE